MIKKCESCPGRCPENCEYCMYYYCEKEVDAKLVSYHYLKMINAIDTEKEWEMERSFTKWFKEYFGL